jgi:hypothetical protein
MALSKADFLAGARVRVKPVSVPELGDVFIRSLPSEERDAWEASVVGDGGAKKNLRNLRARLVARVLCDEKGTPWFADADKGAAELAPLDSAAIDFLFEEARKHSRMRREDVEEVEKNSASAPNAASGTA